ncbi:MAG: SAM-dependent methyltransferase [Candidatus Altiarchaeota archaeon]|nr:SAM-dependent methyltransferase [Candidatus Altiarchaeota archaeon]
MDGKVYLVGCGLGEKHLTLQALKAIRDSEVILYDRLLDKRILEKAECKKIPLGKKMREPMPHEGWGKKGKGKNQERINKLLLKYANEGKTVAVLKVGDIFHFSRGFDAYRFLRSNGVEVEVVPGVSTHQVLSELGIPLTYRDGSSSVSLINANWISESKECGGLDADTLVFYMPVGNLENIVGKVRRRKRKVYCMLVENAGKEDYRVISGGLGDIVRLAGEALVEPPAIFVVSPYERKPYCKRITAFYMKGDGCAREIDGIPVEGYPLDSSRSLSRVIKEAETLYVKSPQALDRLCKTAPVKLLNSKTILVGGAATAASSKKAGLHVDFMI